MVAGAITTSSFPTGLILGSDDRLVGQVLKFITGTNVGKEAGIITSYDNATGTITLQDPLTAAPSIGDQFVVN